MGYHTNLPKAVAPGPHLNKKTIRRSRDHLIFNIGIPILVRRHLYIETAPWTAHENNQYNGFEDYLFKIKARGQWVNTNLHIFADAGVWLCRQQVFDLVHQAVKYDYHVTRAVKRGHHAIFLWYNVLRAFIRNAILLHHLFQTTWLNGNIKAIEYGLDCIN